MISNLAVPALVVISGASKGIGKAIAYQFASKGFDLALCARREQELQILQTEIQAQFPNVRVHIFSADLSQKAEVRKFVAFVLNLNQKISVLVNNVGKFAFGKMQSEEEGLLENLIETNLYSAYYLTKGLIGKMIEQKNGHIFNICSVASFKTHQESGSYAISKHALLGFSKVLREETKTQGIRVTTVMPSATLTDSWAGVEISPERLSRPEDIAQIVYAAYQLSPHSVVEDLIIRPQLGDL